VSQEGFSNSMKKINIFLLNTGTSQTDFGSGTGMVLLQSRYLLFLPKIVFPITLNRLIENGIYRYRYLP
jgi:hypothetical protein